MKVQNYEIKSDFAPHLLSYQRPEAVKDHFQFLFFYTILTCIEIYAEIAHLTTLVYLTKPLLMVSLACFFITSKTSLEPRQKQLFLIALFFALGGDVLLMIRGMHLFIPGLASFLIMQLFYISVFSRQIKTKTTRADSLLSAIPFLGYAITLFTYIAPNLTDPVIKVAVAIYAASISVMSWLAFRRRSSVSRVSFLYVFLGALLFMVSDSLIAIGRFIAPIPLNGLWVMGTYSAAQLFITLGLIKTNQAE